MNKRFFLRSVSLAALAIGVALPAAAQWKPTRPINLIVPWAAGGSTDQVTRVTAAELEKALGQTIVIVNQPGASGAIGTKSALDAPKDGYTWTAGAAQDLGAYQALGSLNSSIKDWHLFLNVANIQVIAVNPSRPWKNAKELIDDMKKRPGQIAVATAGVTSAGHNAMDLIVKATGVKYKEVSYDGGNPAGILPGASRTRARATNEWTRLPHFGQSPPCGPCETSTVRRRSRMRRELRQVRRLARGTNTPLLSAIVIALLMQLVV